MPSSRNAGVHHVEDSRCEIFELGGLLGMDELGVEQLLDEPGGEAVRSADKTVWRPAGQSDRMNPANYTSESEPLVLGLRVEISASTSREEREKEGLLPVTAFYRERGKGLSLVIRDWRNNRNVGCGKLTEELVFFGESLFSPSPGTVELGNQVLLVASSKSVDPVYVAGIGRKSSVEREAKGTFHRGNRDFRCQHFKASHCLHQGESTERERRWQHCGGSIGKLSGFRARGEALRRRRSRSRHLPAGGEGRARQIA